MHQRYWKFNKPEPSSVWIVDNIPEGAIGPVVTHIETDDGIILQPDHQRRIDDTIELQFGVQQISGIAYGQYYLEDDKIVVSNPGGVVNVTVNQYTQGTNSQ